MPAEYAGRPRASIRLDIDSADVGRGFGQVVLAVAEILRELLERQTIRRIDAGDLDADQIERLGTTLLSISQQLGELRDVLQRPSKRPPPNLDALSTVPPDRSRRDTR